jgi:hypothetical protein
MTFGGSVALFRLFEVPPSAFMFMGTAGLPRAETLDGGFRPPSA